MAEPPLCGRCGRQFDTGNHPDGPTVVGRSSRSCRRTACGGRSLNTPHYPPLPLLGEEGFEE